MATILLGEGAYAAIDLFMVVRGLVTAALVVGVAPSPVQVAYRLTATYAVKGTQIIGLNITSDAAIEAQAVHFIDAVYGSAPVPVTAVQYPASIPLFSPGILVAGVDESIAIGVNHLQADSAADPAPVVFGYSQGAAVVSEYKRAFNAEYADAGPDSTVPRPTFVMIGNIEGPTGASTNGSSDCTCRSST